MKLIEKKILPHSIGNIESFGKIRFLIKITPDLHKFRKLRPRNKDRKILLQVSTQAVRLLLSITCRYSKALAGLRRRQPMLLVTFSNSEIIGTICLLLLRLLQVKCLESASRSLRSIYIQWRKIVMFRK